MWQCGSNFTHLVQFSKSSTHELVTGGVYRVARHPGYMGWFWWSIGTQMVLQNPLCVCAYAYAGHTFFAERIPAEERALVHFFGKQYVLFIPTLFFCNIADGTSFTMG
jgi:protein-S-isoprenylcysteine O-methyltransferase